MDKFKKDHEVTIAQVFVDRRGKFGNPVGIVKDEDHQIDEEERQKAVTKLNFSETVFIDSLGTTPDISIFNPQHKVKFAGHAVLGTVICAKSVNNNFAEVGGFVSLNNNGQL